MNKTTNKCFKGMNPTDVVVTNQEGMKIYGIFEKINDTKKERRMTNEYAFASVSDICDDIVEGEEIHVEFCEDIQEWATQFGTENDFSVFEPDSHNQTYIDFTI